jgi:alpha-tubulin suppressor-like RCC1 family protein
MTIHPSRLLAAIASALLLAVAARAQNAIRTWDRLTYDTDAYALPIVHIAQGTGAMVVRADGRIYVQGPGGSSISHGQAPTLPSGVTYTKVEYSVCSAALRSDGNLVFWRNPAIPPPLTQPAPPPPGTTYVDVSTGRQQIFATRSDGVVVVFNAQDGSLFSMPQLPTGVTVVKGSAGDGSWLLLLSNGQIMSWGANLYGECNVPALPAGLTYVDLYSSNQSNHVIARRSDGSVVAWGDNTYGQCNIPTLPAGVSYVDFALSLIHTLALRSDGTLAAWGVNLYGECNLTPLPPGAVVVQISAGTPINRALLADGRVLTWGGRYGEQAIPQPAPGERWVDAAANEVVLGLTSDGHVLGFGKTYPNDMTQAPPLPSGMRYERVFVGTRNAAAIRSDGQLFVWGDNFYGQANVPAPPSGVRYVDVAMSFQHTVAVRSDGQAIAIGDPSFGVLNIPQPPPGVGYVGVDVEYLETVLLRSDGNVTYLGDLGSGQGNVPTLPAGLSYVQVAVGFSHVAALRSDGRLIVWGSGLPVPIPALPPGVVYVEISSGLHHMLLRRSDGRVVVWGVNFQRGQDQIPALAPGESAVQVSAHGDQSMMRVGPTCTYVTFASGCAGSRPAPSLVPRDTPRIGSTMKVTLFDLPQSAAFMILGWGQTAPVSLAGVGMPGCYQHVTVDGAVFLLGQNQQARWELAIPNWVGLVGFHFHNQAVVLDPAANALGAVVSDAAEAVIGHW